MIKGSRQIFIFFFCFVVVTCVWSVMLGLNFNKLMGGNDAYHFYLYLKQLLALEEISLHKNTYRIDLLGGSHPILTLGKFPFVEIYKFFNIKAVHGYNMSVILAQTLVAYFSISILGLIQNQEKIRIYLFFFFVVLITAFSPVIGWRIHYGHLSLLYGVLPVLALGALLENRVKKRSNTLNIILTVIVFKIAITFITYQTFYYSIVFGAPILLLRYFSLNNLKKSLDLFLFASMVVVISLLISISDFVAIFNFFNSDELARNIHSNHITYSYLTLSFKDLLHSLFASSSIVGSSRLNPFFTHELNYPLLAILLLLLVNLRLNKKLAQGLFAILCLCLCLSMDIKPFSTLLLEIPLMEKFRVPMRSLLVYSMIALPLLLVPLKESLNSCDNKNAFYSCLIFLGALLLPRIITESLTLLALGLFVHLAYRNHYREHLKLFLPYFCLALLAANFLGGFTERALVFFNIADFERELEQKISNSNLPKTRNALTRYNPINAKGAFRENIVALMRLSSISGVKDPNGRFFSVYNELSGLKRMHPFAQFYVDPRNPQLSKMLDMYNVIMEIELTDKGLNLSKLKNKGGHFFIPKRIKVSKKIKETIEEIKVSDNITNLAMIDKNMKNIKPKNDNCVESDFRVDTMKSSIIEVRVNSKYDCLLVFPSNYSSLLSTNFPRKVKLMPINHSLLGAVIRKGVYTFKITTINTRKFYLDLLKYIGGVLLIGMTLGQFFIKSLTEIKNE